MSLDTLHDIHEKMVKMLAQKFGNNQKLVSKIKSITTPNSFAISTLTGTKTGSHDELHTIDCHTRLNLSQFKKGDEVSVTGTLRLHPENIGHIILYVTGICLVTEQHKMDEKIQIHHDLKEILSTKTHRKQIDKFYARTPPMTISNVGLIVLSDTNDNMVTKFKQLFSQRCIGKLFIYRLKRDDLENDMEASLEYFRKYHQIDLICILSHNMTANELLDMSSKNNVKYLFRRREFPYLVSITFADNNDQLWKLLSNNYLKTVDDCIRFISTIQNTFAIKINEAIQYGMQKSQTIIDNYKHRIDTLDDKVSRQILLLIPYALNNRDKMNEWKKMLMSEMESMPVNEHSSVEDTKIEASMDPVSYTDENMLRGDIQQGLIPRDQSEPVIHVAPMDSQMQQLSIQMDELESIDNPISQIKNSNSIIELPNQLGNYPPVIANNNAHQLELNPIEILSTQIENSNSIIELENQTGNYPPVFANNNVPLGVSPRGLDRMLANIDQKNDPQKIEKPTAINNDGNRLIIYKEPSNGDF